MATFRDEERTTAWWKGNGVARFTGHRPFVWFDDELDLEKTMEFLTNVEHKIVYVDPDTGLTKADVDEAYDWLMSL